MATIPPLLEEPSGRGRSGSHPPQEKQKSKWLYELERAQWDMKQRPQTLGQNRLGTSEAEPRASPTPTPVKAEILEMPADPSAAQRAQAVPSTRAESLPREITSGFPAIPKDPMQQSTAIMAERLLPITAMGGSDRAAMQSIALGSQASPVLRNWEKQRTYMEHKDGEASLWLRDTRISASQGVELAGVLRKRFAELGVKLARFTLNGQSYEQLKSSKPVII